MSLLILIAFHCVTCPSDYGFRGSLKLDIVIQILTHTWWELLLMKSALFESERVYDGISL